MKVGYPIKILLTGQPYVKKNQQRSGAGGYRYNSPGYNNWHRNAKHRMMELGYDVGFADRRKKLKKLGQNVSGMKGLVNMPVTLQCRFYMRTDGIVDMSNLYEGVQDLLVECGVLEDDNWHIVASHDGSRCFKDKDDPRIEITILPLREVSPNPGARSIARELFG